MLSAFLLLLSSLTAASQADFPICSENLYGQYYIVFGSSIPPEMKSAAQQEVFGVPFDLYPTACEVYGLRPANITVSLIPNLVDLMHQCSIISSKRTRQEDPEPALWINSYEGLPNLLECNSLYVYGNIFFGLTLYSALNSLCLRCAKCPLTQWGQFLLLSRRPRQLLRTLLLS